MTRTVRRVAANGITKHLASIFILLLLLAQTTLAVAANILSHENEAAAPHSGHHVHEHLPDGDSSGDPLPASSGNGIDKHCNFCHPSQKLDHATHSMAQLVLGTRLSGYFQSYLYSSFIPQWSERPNWHVFA